MVKKAKAFKIEKRGDGRHVVRKRGGGFVNGLEKTKALIDAGLVTTKLPKPKEEKTEA